jgi:hypothetical protein
MKKSNRKMNIKKEDVQGEVPFIIHVADRQPLFPTHTHGMKELGMPEFIMDPLSFGSYGTADRIYTSYKYFERLENQGKLDAIKNGDTLKLTARDLITHKQINDSYVYCYRRVNPEFEAIKLAYIDCDLEAIDPGMWFVQIYVEGDDYVLTDMYYKGGIKW